MKKVMVVAAAVTLLSSKMIQAALVMTYIDDITGYGAPWVADSYFASNEMRFERQVGPCSLQTS